MKKITRIILLLLGILVLLLFLLFLISFLFPGKVKLVDNVRLPIQGEIMGTVGDYILGDFYIDEEGNIIESPIAINLETIKLYISELKTGDIFFTDSEKYASSEFIPGKRKHSVIYLGTQQDIEEFYGSDSTETALLKQYYVDKNDSLIIDAGSSGVNIRSFSKLSNLEQISFLKAMIAFRLNTSHENVKEFLNYAIIQNGKGYNYDMTDIDDESFYCSQLLYKGLKQIGYEIENKSTIFTREYISPQDMVDYILNDGIENEEYILIFNIERIDGDLIVQK